MSITAAELRHIFPQCADPETWAGAISKAWERFSINSKNARAGFLGIIGNETGGLREVKREIMNYTFERAAQVWPGKAMGASRGAMLARIERGPEAFTNWIYAGIIGNGDEASGDGWRYRGGGIIQLTGRANYRACGKALGIDLEAHPERITEPGVSALAAAWFMAEYVRILPRLDSAAEADFRAAAARVGHAVDQDRMRLYYRRKAMEIVRPAGYVRDDTGNVRRTDISESGIVKDSNTGSVIASATAAAGAAAPIVTSIAGMPWQTAAVMGIVVLGLASLAVWYFLKVKKRRKRMNADGIA